MADRYQFSCPACGAEIVVDAAVRRELLEAGCVSCDAPVGTLDFARGASESTSR